MLTQQTIAKLRTLKLTGMANGFEHQLTTAEAHNLAFEERFGLLVDQEATYRENRRLKRLLRTAKFKAHAACVEDIDFRHNRGLDRSQIASLASCQWIEKGLNLIVTGPTGCGKTWLACAFGNQACRLGKSAMFQRLPLLLEELQLAHHDGSFRNRLRAMAKVDLLILDDLGMGALNAQARADILEIIESRVPGRSTIVTSQIAVSGWHKYLGEGNPTVADAILDRVVSGSMRVEMRGESMRLQQTAEMGLI